MRNLLQILVRYSNFLLFIVLEVVAFIILLSNNFYPKSSVFSTANRFVAKQIEVVDHIKGYFHLQSENDRLIEENIALRHEITRLHNTQERIAESMVLQDSSDYCYSHLQYQYLPARVIGMTHHLNQNYLTINKGSRDSITVGMGVRSDRGVVGIVCTVSEHFALVLPIIHARSQISCRLKENDYIGILVWEGGDTHTAQLKDIATHIAVAPGDILVTSGLTYAFPQNIPVGIVKDVTINNGKSYYDIDVELATDFKRLTTVQVIHNILAEEQNDLEGTSKDSRE